MQALHAPNPNARDLSSSFFSSSEPGDGDHTLEGVSNIAGIYAYLENTLVPAVGTHNVTQLDRYSICLYPASILYLVSLVVQWMW